MTTYRTVVMLPNENPRRVAIVQDYDDETEYSMLKVLNGCCMNEPKQEGNGITKSGPWICSGCGVELDPQPTHGIGPRYWVTDKLDKNNCARWSENWVGVQAKDLRIDLTFPLAM
jgi:hypothetical protein